MAHARLEELGTELNNITEYAGISLTFEVVPGDEYGGDAGHGCVLVYPTADSREIIGIYIVDVDWAIGNAQRLHDHTSRGKVIAALELSHPDIKGVSDKSRN